MIGDILLTQVKSKKKLDGQIKIKIEDGLKSTVEWYYYNQKWWKML